MSGDLVLRELTNKKAELLRAADKVYIVNAGRMNHGKSSLLNSLLGRGEVFKTRDVRETVVNQQECYGSNVYVVDTPGLDADDSDDEKAYDVYKKANFILFVHNPKTGELHKQEIEHLRTIAAVVGEKYFWQHMALVLTFSEEYEDEQIVEIKAKIENAISNHFKQTVPMFLVSNSTFEDARQETDPGNKSRYLEWSGIPDLQKFLTSHIPQWQLENLQLQEARFQTAQQDALKSIIAQCETIKKKIDLKKAKFDTAKSDLQKRIQKAAAEISQLESQLAGSENSARNAERDLEKLREQHQQEKDSY